MSTEIIVTGAAGFIGRNCVAELNRRGLDRILLVDDLGVANGKWMNLRGLAFDDIISPAEFRRRVGRGDNWCDASGVIHLGACSATTESDADYLLDNNYRFTREACEWALANDIRFVYASSAATYGDGASGYSDEDAHTPQLRPLNMYGYSKHMFDLWALRTGRMKHIVGLKYFNVFGPYEEHKGNMRSVVSKAYREILNSGTLSLFRSYRRDISDGEQRRDFVYVDDAVAITLKLLFQTETNGLFNCGSGKARSWLDLARAVFASLGREPAIRFVDMPPTLRAKYQYFTQADTHKLRTAGYDPPFRSLEDSVGAYVDWLQTDELGE